MGIFVYAHFKVRGQFVGLGSLPCVAQGLNLGDPGFWEMPLPTEPSWSSVCITECVACTGHALFVEKYI